MDWLKSLYQFVQRILFGRVPYLMRPKILREYRSHYCRLLLITREAPDAVRTWRAILEYRQYDLLLTCDRLNYKTRKDGIAQKFKGSTFATHRVGIIELQRIPRKDGTYPCKCIFLADMDMVGPWSPAGDRYAIIAIDQVSRLLIRKRFDEIDWEREFTLTLKKYIGSVHDP